jgi:hypothetical protein
LKQIIPLTTNGEKWIFEIEVSDKEETQSIPFEIFDFYITKKQLIFF